ncbi:cupin domain-containing protein [Candidatus Dependentiae bacterium]|nr:cupin domain-containing protein [Candidatus Dependentiae bacterium]
MVFNKNIFDLATENTFFRKELITGKHSQVVLMSIPAGGEIGLEQHDVDQILVFVQGDGQVIIKGQTSPLGKNHLVFIPAGVEHNFKNTGSKELKLFTIYAPSEHEIGTVQKIKPE